MDLRDRALKTAEGKCHKCGIEVNLDTAMFDYKESIDPNKVRETDDIQVSCHKCYLDNFDKVMGSTNIPVVGSAAKLWIHSYIISPVKTLLVSVVLSVVAAAFLFNILSTNIFPTVVETKVNLDFKSQIKKLDETERSLKNLLVFVKSQRESASLSEKRIILLEAEKLRLEPLVNADKATVEALFNAQEARASANAIKERWFGFGLGFLASLFASFLIIIVKYFFVTRRNIQNKKT